MHGGIGQYMPDVRKTCLPAQLNGFATWREMSGNIWIVEPMNGQRNEFIAMIRSANQTTGFVQLFDTDRQLQYIKKNCPTREYKMSRAVLPSAR